MTKPQMFTENSQGFGQISILEGKNATDNKPMKIEGVAGKGGIINGNTRYYSVLCYTKATEKCQKKVKEGKMLGEVDHPTYGGGTLRNSAVMFDELWMEGDLMKYKATVLPTDAGKLLESLLRAGVGVGNSTRGYGESTWEDMNGVQVCVIDPNTFELDGIDFVIEQSNPYGKPTKFENQGGEQIMNLDELKAKYPELVIALAQETKTALEKELTESITAKVTESMNADLAVKITEATEAGKKSAMESAEVVEALAMVTLVKENFAKLFNAQPTDEELKAQLISANESVAEVTKKYNESVAELAKVNGIVEGQKKEEAKATAIAEAIKDYKFADLLKTQLAECVDAEAVKACAEAKKAFIESVVALNGGAPAGQGQNLGGEGDKGNMDEELARQKRLAGIVE